MPLKPIHQFPPQPPQFGIIVHAPNIPRKDAVPIAKREPPPPPQRKQSPPLWIIIGIGIPVFIFVTMCSNSSDKRSAADKESSTSATTTTARSSAPPQAWKTMPGNGTHKMGGMDGKDWGIWQATAPGDCQWSIRAVRTYTGGEVLYEGTAAPGEVVRVNIQPDGKVAATTGMIDGDHRIVFMTNGCGAWQIAS